MALALKKPNNTEANMVRPVRLVSLGIEKNYGT